MSSEVELLDSLIAKCNELKKEIAKVVVGQETIINQVLIAMFSSGHCLLVGVPGLAKTLLVNTIAKTLGLSFNRIQFTPDLMPSDISGSEILNKDRAFEFVEGPVFSNIVLADEINRTPPKTQAALLEAMQEHSVTINGVNHKLPEPFFVLATQNPIEQEGTYPLPEAQMDRFMMKVVITYPNKEEEKEILRSRISPTSQTISPVIKPQDIIHAREVVKEVYIDAKIENYITDIVFASRFPQDYGLSKIKPLIAYGASPRATINLALASRALAFIKRRGYELEINRM